MEAYRHQSPTFGSFILDQYLPNVKCFTRSWRTSGSLLRMHVFPLLETRPMGQIDITGITAVVSRMQEAGYLVTFGTASPASASVPTQVYQVANQSSWWFRFRVHRDILP